MSINILIRFLRSCASFMIIFSICYFLIKYTICKLLKLDKFTLMNKLFLDDLISISISLIFIIRFVSF